jgi:hypothetical protein
MLKLVQAVTLKLTVVQWSMTIITNVHHAALCPVVLHVHDRGLQTFKTLKLHQEHFILPEHSPVTMKYSCQSLPLSALPHHKLLSSVQSLFVPWQFPCHSKTCKQTKTHKL